MKDWNGNKQSTYALLGASNHAILEREQNDYYATDPKALELLCDLEKFDKNIWECACGGGHLSEVLLKNGYVVRSSDIINRNYDTEILDFLSEQNTKKWNGDILTNPPYKYVQEFIEKSISLIPKGKRVIMFLGINFVEGKKRKEFLKKFPIKTIYVSSSRIDCAMGGDFEKNKRSSARCYAWFIWEKGYNGSTEIKWFN